MNVSISELEEKSTFELEALYSAVQRRSVHFSSEVIPNQSFEKGKAAAAREELKKMGELKEMIEKVLGARILEYLGR